MYKELGIRRDRGKMEETPSRFLGPSHRPEGEGTVDYKMNFIKSTSNEVLWPINYGTLLLLDLL